LTIEVKITHNNPGVERHLRVEMVEVFQRDMITVLTKELNEKLYNGNALV